MQIILLTFSNGILISKNTFVLMQIIKIFQWYLNL